MKYTFSPTTKAGIRKLTKATATASAKVVYTFTENGDTKNYVWDKADKESEDDDEYVLVSAKGLRFRKLKDLEIAELPDVVDPVIYKSVEHSAVVACADGYTGTPITVRIEAGAYEGETQEEADSLAVDALNAAKEKAKKDLKCVKITVPDPTPEPQPSSRRKGPFVLETWRGTMKKGSNEIYFDGKPDLKPNEKILVEFEEGRGHEAFTNWPYDKVDTLAQLRARKGNYRDYVRCVEDGHAYEFVTDEWTVFNRHSCGDYFAYGWNPKVVDVTGNKVTVDTPSPIDYTGAIYFDSTAVLGKMVEENNFDLSQYGISASDSLYVSRHLVSVNQYNLVTNFDGVRISSPKGFPTPGLQINNGNGDANPHVINPNFFCWQGQYKYTAPYLHALPGNGQFMGDPYYIYDAILGIYCKGGKVEGARVHNAPSYVLQISERCEAKDSKLTYDKLKYWEYQGWPLHILGGHDATFDGFVFDSPTFQRAFELQQCDRGTFKNGLVKNGAMSQNAGSKGLVEKVKFITTEGSCEADPKILKNPIAQVNMLLPGADPGSGCTFKDVAFIQEGYATRSGALLRTFEMKENSSNLALLNVRSERPDVMRQFIGNNEGLHFALNAQGLKIDGLITKGKGNPIFDYSDNNTDNAPVSIAGPGEAVIDNIDVQKLVIGKGATVKLGENIKTELPLMIP